MSNDWYVVDGCVQTTKNDDLPEIVFTRVTMAGSYAEAVDMFERDLYGIDVYCINADILRECTARAYLVENRAIEQYYVSVDGHENIALSIPVNDS